MHPGSIHCKKNLKSIICENFDDAKFAKSHRAYESEQVVSEKHFGATVSDRRKQSDEDYNNCIAIAAPNIAKRASSI